MILQAAPALRADFAFWPEIVTDPKGFPTWDSVFKNQTWPSKASFVYLQPVRGGRGEAGGSYPKLALSPEGGLAMAYAHCGPLHTETEMRAFQGERAQQVHPQTGGREAAANRAASSLQRLQPVTNYHAFNIVSVNDGQ